MDKKSYETFNCSVCGKTLPEEDLYIFENQNMCDNCAMKKGMYPLEHTGSRRDKISERGRYLSIPKRQKKS